MSGRNRLPAGAVRRASQRRSRPAAAPATLIRPIWCAGDKVRWKEYVGHYLRETVDGQAEVMIGTRTYRVAAGELRSA